MSCYPLMLVAAQGGLFVLQGALQAYEVKQQTEYRIRQEQLLEERERLHRETMEEIRKSHNESLAVMAVADNERYMKLKAETDANIEKLIAQLNQKQLEYDEKIDEMRREHLKTVEEARKKYQESFQQVQLEQRENKQKQDEHNEKQEQKVQEFLERIKREGAEEMRSRELEVEKANQERVDKENEFMKEISDAMESFQEIYRAIQDNNSKLSIESVKIEENRLQEEHKLRSQQGAQSMSFIVANSTITAATDHCKKYLEILESINEITTAIEWMEECYKLANYDKSSIKPGTLDPLNGTLREVKQKFQNNIYLFRQYTITATNVPVDQRQSLTDSVNQLEIAMGKMNLGDSEILALAYDKGDIKSVKLKVKSLVRIKESLAKARAKVPINQPLLSGELPQLQIK